MIDLNSLKGELPLYQEKNPVKLDDPKLAEYFQHYHFARLEGLYDHYHCGVIESEHDFACHHWRKSSAKRTAFVLHGLFDHVGLFLPLVEFLLSKPLNVVAIELPDHGLSPLRYGELSDFTHYSNALNALFKSQQISITEPVTAIGQSTGGAAIFDYLARHQEQTEIDQLVLLAPLLRVRSWLWVKASYVLLHKFLVNVPREFMQNSHDPDFCDFLAKGDPLQPRQISVAWVGAMLRWAKQFDQLPPVDIPALMIQGSADSTVAFRYNTEKYSEKLPQLKVESIDGAMHHLVGEADPWRSQVFSAIDQFIDL